MAAVGASREPGPTLHVLEAAFQPPCRPAVLIVVPALALPRDSRSYHRGVLKHWTFQLAQANIMDAGRVVFDEELAASDKYMGGFMHIVTPSASGIALYVGAALALLLVPGPAVLYIVTRSMAQGRVAGLVSDLGIHAATLVHTLAAALGLSVLLASSAIAFSMVKYAGAAYLIWLGLKKLFGRVQSSDGEMLAPRSYARLFRDGFMVNLLNPKTALFFFAFLPQFAEPERGSLAMQIAFLGLLFAVLGLFTDGCYALLAGTAGGWLRESKRYLEIERYVSGIVFIGLGLTAALAGRDRK